MVAQLIPIVLAGLRMAMQQIILILPTLIAAIVAKIVNSAKRLVGIK